MAGIARRESSIVSAGIAPGFVIFLCVLGVYSESTAITIALGACMITLGIQGLRYAHAAHLSSLATGLFVTLNLALGLLIVSLKVWLTG